MTKKTSKLHLPSEFTKPFCVVLVLCIETISWRIFRQLALACPFGRQVVFCWKHSRQKTVRPRVTWTWRLAIGCACHFMADEEDSEWSHFTIIWVQFKNINSSQTKQPLVKRCLQSLLKKKEKFTLQSSESCGLLLILGVCTHSG